MGPWQGHDVEDAAATAVQKMALEPRSDADDADKAQQDVEV